MKTLMEDQLAEEEKLTSGSSTQAQPAPLSADAAAEARRFGTQVAAITIAAAVLYASISFGWPKFSRAEVFFAECAREMIASSNYVTPLYHGQAFFDKPILVYWFIIGCFKSFGISHFAARIPSIIASAATVAASAYACRALFGQRAGLLAAMALATSFMYLSFSALCMSDTMLVLVDSITLILMYAGYRSSDSPVGNTAVPTLENGSQSASSASSSNSETVKSTGWTRSKLWFLAAASMGLGFLTKGPVAVVLPAVFFIAFLIAEKKLSLVKPKHIALGTLALCLIASPWFFLAYNANGMEAITYFFIRENLQRFSGATYDTHRPIYFMLVSLMGGFLPWSIFLPPILYLSIKQFLSDRKAKLSDEKTQAQLYLWLWIAVVIGFFSVSRGKIDYYALPAFPACAILTGYYLSKWIEGRNKLAGGAVALLNVALIVAGAGIGLFLSVLPYPASVPPIVVGLAPIAAGVFGLFNLYRGRMLAATATVFSGVVIAGSLFATVAMPVMTQMQPALSYADQIKIAERDKPISSASTNSSNDKQTKKGVFTFDHNTIGQNVIGDENSVGIGMYAGLEHWIDEVTFRTGREPVKVASATELGAFQSTPGSHWLMIKNTDFDAMPEDVRARWNVVERKGFIPKSLNPGYIFKHKGDLTGGSELILARSK